MTGRCSAGYTGSVSLSSDDLPECAPEVQRIAADLLPHFYEELRRAARRSRRQLGAGATLQTTALVHEAFLRLGAGRTFNNTSHFLRASALAMRHALISHLQERRAGKRGGGAPHLTLSNAADLSIQSEEGLLALEEALQRLAHESPRQADVVECRFFGGLTEQETAHALNTSLRTVQREWLKARAWLFHELSEAAQQAAPDQDAPR